MKTVVNRAELFGVRTSDSKGKEALVIHSYSLTTSNGSAMAFESALHHHHQIKKSLFGKCCSILEQIFIIKVQQNCCDDTWWPSVTLTLRHFVCPSLPPSS